MAFLRSLSRFFVRNPPKPEASTPPRQVSAASIAESTTIIETCAATPARFAGGPTARFHDSHKNPFQAWSTAPVTLRKYRFRDVVLDRTHMVLLHQGAVITETNYLQPQAAIAALRVNPETLIRPHIANTAATCFDHWDTNYYHWLAHSIPVLHAILQQSTPTTLILPQLRPWQAETISLIGAADLPAFYTAPGQQYFFPELDYFDIIAGNADFAISPLSRAAYAKMAEIHPVPPKPHRKIYIDRGSNANRLMPNEAALTAALRTRGYETIRPEAFTVTEQIAIFQAAAIVVAQLGAGLANIAFCQPGAIVYELLPSHHQNPCFLAMAMQGGLQYWGDVFETGVTASDHTSAWTQDIDVAHLIRRLEELESK
jgi:hypothetical protein